MDFQVPAAIQTLEANKGENSRYAAILILKELAVNSPVYFSAHLDVVFDKILVPFHDRRQKVREAAADLLAAVIVLIPARERPQSQYLIKLQTEATKGLKASSSVEVIHGSLWIFRELFMHGKEVSLFMPNYLLKNNDVWL